MNGHIQAKIQVHQMCPQVVFTVMLGDHTKRAGTGLAKRVL